MKEQSRLQLLLASSGRNIPVRCLGVLFLFPDWGGAHPAALPGTVLLLLIGIVSLSLFSFFLPSRLKIHSFLSLIALIVCFFIYSHPVLSLVHRALVPPTRTGESIRLECC